MSAHRSSAWPLSWMAVALIVYASLYPFSAWHWPDSHVFRWLLPKLPQEALTDLVGNLLGYLPLGAVLTLAHLRSGRSPLGAAARAVLTASALSYALELIQFTVPGRVPSITDWLLNTLGASWGALVAVTALALGLVDVWHRLRERWFIAHAGHGLALLCLWPLGLLFPPPLPLGQGQVWPHVQAGLHALAQDPAMHGVLGAWAASRGADASPTALLASSDAAWIEVLVVACGLLAPMCLAGALARPRRLRWALLCLTVCAGWTVSTLSSALNFGPSHALAWLSLPALLGLSLGALGGAMLVGRTRLASAVAGVLVLLALIVLIHLVPPDPYYAQTLQSWEQGRFIRMHGLSRWVGLAWPHVALVWLLGRVWHRSDEAA